MARRVDLGGSLGLQRLADSVLAVLESVGMIFQNEDILRALEASGAVVDYEAEVAKFPCSLSESFVERIRGEPSSAAEVDDWQKVDSTGLPVLGSQVCPYVYDLDRDEERRTTRADLIEFCKLGDTLHPKDGVGHCVLLTEVDPLIEPLEAALVLAEYVHEPQPAFAWNLAQIDYLLEMGEILGIKDWCNWGGNCIAHPLRYDRHTAAKYVRAVHEGRWGAGMSGMPVAGISHPVTVEGFIVVASAEFLAMWMAGRSLAPESRLSGGIWPGSADMKTGAVSYCAFDALFHGFATRQFLLDWAGINIRVSEADYCAAKRPGLYAAAEKSLKAMTLSLFTGQPLEAGTGMLDDGRLLSDVQLLLDREMGGALQYLSREVSPTPENIALDTILSIGTGLHASYLGSEHTARHYRDALWLPGLVDRTGWAGFSHEREMIQKARERSRSLVAQYQKPEGREDALAKMREVVARARRELCHAT